MTLGEFNYIEQQLFQLAPLPLIDENFPHGFEIQIRSGSRKTGSRTTGLIKITPEQLRKIELILLRRE